MTSPVRQLLRNDLILHVLIDFRESDPPDMGGFQRDSAVRAVAPLPKQVSIAVLGHPAGPCEVTIIDSLTALRFSFRIKAEQDFDHFAPICAFLSCVEQAEVEDHV